MGASDFGSITLAFTLINILSVFSVFGMEKLSLRYIQIHYADKSDNLIKEFIYKSQLICLFIGLTVIVLAILTRNYFQIVDKVIPALAINMVLCIFIVDALLRIQRGILQGLNEIVCSGIPDFIIRPMLFFASIYILVNITSYSNVPHVLECYLLVSIITLAISSYFIHVKHKPFIEHVAARNFFLRLNHKTLLIESFFLMASEIVFLLNSNVDILMISGLLGDKATGIYSLANRGAMLIAFIIGSIVIVKGAHIAKLHKQNNIKDMQSMVTILSRMMFLVTIIIVTIYYLLGDQLLGYFGAEYLDAKTSLLILSMSQLINAFTGGVGIILLMTGHSKFVVLTVSVSAVINIALNYLLIPLYNIEGAAIATAISVTVWNLVLMIYVIKKIHIDPSISGVFAEGKHG